MPGTDCSITFSVSHFIVVSCDELEQLRISDANSRLILYFHQFRSQMTGQLTILLSPLLGAIADRYGPSTLMNILGTSGTIGIALLIVAVKTGLDALLFAAFICLGLMAVSSTIMTVLTGLAFQGRSRAR